MKRLFDVRIPVEIVILFDKFITVKNFSRQNEQAEQQAVPSPEHSSSWYSRLIGVGGLEATRESHSKLLAENKTVYELQVDFL